MPLTSVEALHSQNICQKTLFSISLWFCTVHYYLTTPEYFLLNHQKISSVITDNFIAENSKILLRQYLICQEKFSLLIFFFCLPQTSSSCPPLLRTTYNYTDFTKQQCLLCILFTSTATMILNSTYTSVILFIIFFARQSTIMSIKLN